MKILAFVDMHGSLKALKKLVETIKQKKPKVIVCAGDISIFEQRLDYFIERLSKFGVPFLIIPGNHESGEMLSRACNKSKDAYYLHKQVYDKITDYLFIGNGGGGFSDRDDKFDKISKRFAKETAKGKKVILVTHQPPYKTKLDRIGKTYAGNKSYRRFIDKNKVDLVVCGHLHENAGKTDKVGKTFLINPGPYGKIIDI